MSCSDCPEPFELCVEEEGIVDYIGTLRSKPVAPATVGDVVPLSALTGLTLTLLDSAGVVINYRNVQSVLNVNGGTYHATSGLFTMTFGTLDNVMSNRTGSREVHQATFKATFTGGVKNWDVIKKVKKLTSV